MIFASLLLILVAIVFAVLGVVQGSDPLLVASIVASLLTAVLLAVSARQAAALRLAAGHGASVPTAMPPEPGDGAPVPEPAPGTGDETAELRTVGGDAPPTGEPTGTEVVAAPGEPEGTDGADAPAEQYAADLDDLSVPDGERVPEDEQPVTPVSIPSQYSPTDRDDARPAPAGTGPVAVPAAVPSERPVPGLNQMEFDLHPDPGAVPDLRAVDGPVDRLGHDDEPLDEPPAQLVPLADTALVAVMSASVMVVDGRPRYHLASCPHLVNREAEPVPVNEAVGLGFTPCSLCEPDTALLAQARRV